MTALAELVVPKTKEEQLAALLVLLAGKKFPTTSWQAGGVARTLVETHAEVLADHSGTIAAIAKGGFLDDAEGAWLTLLAAQFFGLTRKAAVPTDGPVTLVAAAAAGPYTLAAGAVLAATGADVRFRSVTGGTLPLGGAIAPTFRAESPGAAWNVGNGSIEALLTSLAGVTVENFFTAVELTTGAGTATITPAAAEGDTPTADVDFAIKVVLSGAPGTGKFRYSIDGGDTYNGSDVTIPSGGWYEVGATGCRVYFAGTFVLNDVYEWASRSWITTSGTDEESDEALRSRCRDRWGTLGAGANAAAYRSWALAASDEITRVAATANGSTGDVTVLVAGAAGAVSATALAAAQAYIEERQPLTVEATVTNVNEEPVSVEGTIYVAGVTAAAALAAAQANLDALALSLAIGGDALGGGDNGVSRAAIIEAIMAVPGVVNVTLTAPAADTLLATDDVATFTYGSLTAEAA